MANTNKKTVYTRIQNKHDLEVNWMRATGFIPLDGELVIFDSEVDSQGSTLKITLNGETVDAVPRSIDPSDETLRKTPINYVRYKIGDGQRNITDPELPFVGGDEASVRLANDLYTYTPIGKITEASNTNPHKVASRGDTLKNVFDAVFGTQQDQQPTITTSSAKLSVSAGTTSYGGGEYGTTVASTDVTVTFTLANSCTANYGYRCGTTKTTGSQTFYYPITKQNEADITITLPSGQTASSDLVTAGTFVSANSNVLYCNFNSSKQVSIKINLPAGNVTTAKQTRYGQISASVTLGAAQKENQLTAGTAITKFLTYLGNDAADTSNLSGGTKSNTAGSYTIKAGYVPYTYCLSSSLPAELPTANRSQSLPSSITASGGTDATYLYIFIPAGNADISGMTASGFSVPFTKVESSKSYAVNNSQTTTYKVFKTDGAVKGDTFNVS